MEAIKSTDQTTTAQAATGTKNKAAETTGDSEFDLTLKSLVKSDSANQVSEEDLFAALVQERIKSEKGDEALAKFKELFDTASNSLKKGDGYIPVEDACKEALKQFRDSGELSSEETDAIYSQAFAGAQLDENTDALFDGRGGPGDTTIAVATLEQALLSSRVKIEKYDSGDEIAATRSIEEASNGKSAAATGTGAAGIGAGFLYKPVSDSDGKVAVLLPPPYSGLVESVRLVGPNGDILETGRYGGNGNGGREHFRFSKPGSSYPDGMVVEVTMKSGETVRYTISDSSARQEDTAGTGSEDTSETGSESATGAESTGSSSTETTQTASSKTGTSSNKDSTQDTSL